MLKDATYKEKFLILKPWMTQIIDVVKKELRNEHLNRYPLFVKKYFPGKNSTKLTNEEMAVGYHTAVTEDGEQLGEIIAQLWMMKNTEIYDYFEQKLAQIQPNFTELTSIEKNKAQEMTNESVKQFGPLRTYLFCVFNSVVFPKEVYDKLAEQSHTYQTEKEEQRKSLQEKQSFEALKREYEQELARLSDKYEKKLSGWEKKYTADIASLKKQLSALQKKLQPTPAA